MSDRLNDLKIENKRLKTQVQELENRISNIVGVIEIESSGGSEKRDVLNNMILEIFNSTTDQLNIVSPKIDQFYVEELKKVAGKGIPILLITYDRHSIEKKSRPIYDELKSTNGITIINNASVKYLLVFNSEKAIYAGGSLDKQELSESVLITTSIKESGNLRKIAEIFTMMLPSFMRK